MPVNPQSTGIMTPPQLPVHAKLLEAGWYPTSREEDSPAEHEVNHSVPLETYDSTDGVCNELARIALNRSAVMQVYDSMFPKSGMFRATARRRSPRRDLSRPGWVQRALDLLFGPTPR
jgi:hypothetical protein